MVLFWQIYMESKLLYVMNTTRNFHKLQATRTSQQIQFYPKYAAQGIFKCYMRVQMDVKIRFSANRTFKLYTYFFSKKKKST